MAVVGRRKVLSGCSTKDPSQQQYQWEPDLCLAMGLLMTPPRFTLMVGTVLIWIRGWWWPRCP